MSRDIATQRNIIQALTNDSFDWTTTVLHRDAQSIYAASKHNGSWVHLLQNKLQTAYAYRSLARRVMKWRLGGTDPPSITAWRVPARATVATQQGPSNIMNLVGYEVYLDWVNFPIEVSVPTDADHAYACYRSALDQSVYAEDRVAKGLWDATVAIEGDDPLSFTAFTMDTVEALRTRLNGKALNAMFMIVPLDVWDDITVLAEFKPVGDVELIMRGCVGELDGMRVYTDATRHYVGADTLSGEVYMFSSSQNVGCIVQGSPVEMTMGTATLFGNTFDCARGNASVAMACIESRAIVKAQRATMPSTTSWKNEGRCPQCGELGAFIGFQPTCSEHGPY